MSGLIYLKAFHALGGLSETLFMLLYCARFFYLKVSDNISAFISGRQNQDQAGEMFLLKWKQKGPSADFSFSTFSTKQFAVVLGLAKNNTEQLHLF